MIDIEEVVRRLDRRDDSTVVAYRQIGLPIFRINSLLTLQEAGSLGAVEEFVLRCLRHSVDTLNDMHRFLGLPPKIIASQIAQLYMEDAVTQVDDSPPRYSLTRAGRTRLEDASSARLMKEQIPIYIDGITRNVIAADPQVLWTNAQLEAARVAAIAPTPRRPPRASEIELDGINRMFALVAGADRPGRRAVRLDAIVGRISVVFRRGLALAFKSSDGRRVSIGFAIDGRNSEEHEIAFARSEDPQRSIIFGMMFDADRRRREAQLVARELRADLPGVVPKSVGSPEGRPTLSLRRPSDDDAISVDGVRALNVYEHPQLLDRALEVAASRLLIVSPAIRASVVDEAFVERLTQRLERGVQVTIAHGTTRRDLGETDADRDALASLIALSKTFQNFRLVRKGSTHAKVLLVDNSFCVVTTFNWLSFNGDPTQPMREEEGTLIQDPVAVNRYFDSWAGRLQSPD